MSETIWQAATLIIPIVLAVVFHEVAHGLVASWLGDPTAKVLGRLSLNPLRHVDPVGTVILPGMLALAHAPVFGWAKPVPVDARYLRDPRRDMLLVGIAGPASNLLMALVSALLLGFVLSERGGLGMAPLFVAQNLLNFILINVSLALFNLLPIPPFDGSHVVEGLLPERLAEIYGSFRSKGLLLVFAAIVVLPYLFPNLHLLDRVLGPPVDWMTHRYLDLAALVAGVPAEQLLDGA